jgi:hypothetical protein
MTSLVQQARKNHDRNHRGTVNRPLLDDAPLNMQTAASQWVDAGSYSEESAFPREFTLLFGDGEVAAVFGGCRCCVHPAFCSAVWCWRWRHRCLCDTDVTWTRAMPRYCRCALSLSLSLSLSLALSRSLSLSLALSRSLSLCRCPPMAASLRASLIAVRR